MFIYVNYVFLPAGYVKVGREFICIFPCSVGYWFLVNTNPVQSDAMRTFKKNTINEIVMEMVLLWK